MQHLDVQHGFYATFNGKQFVGGAGRSYEKSFFFNNKILTCCIRARRHVLSEGLRCKIHST